MWVSLIKNAKYAATAEVCTIHGVTQLSVQNSFKHPTVEEERVCLGGRCLHSVSAHEVGSVTCDIFVRVSDRQLMPCPVGFLLLSQCFPWIEKAATYIRHSFHPRQVLGRRRCSHLTLPVVTCRL